MPLSLIHILPVTRSDGAFFSSSSKPPSSSGAKPIRCSPVSILIWMAAGFPAASAAACSSEAKPARPHANVKFASTAAESCHGSALLMTRISLSLIHILGDMNPDYREALYLTYFEGMSYAQAAEVMGKSVKQITNLVYRGKESLRCV